MKLHPTLIDTFFHRTEGRYECVLSHTLETGGFMRRAEVSVDEGADGGMSCSSCAVEDLRLHQQMICL